MPTKKADFTSIYGRLLFFQWPKETNKEYCKRLGITTQSFYAYGGAASPTIQTIVNISEKLGLTKEQREWLAFGNDGPPKLTKTQKIEKDAYAREHSID